MARAALLSPRLALTLQRCLRRLAATGRGGRGGQTRLTAHAVRLRVHPVQVGGRGVNSYKRGGGTRKKPHRTYIHRRGNKRGTVLIPTLTRTRLPKTSSEICAVSEKYRMHSHGFAHRDKSKFENLEIRIVSTRPLVLTGRLSLSAHNPIVTVHVRPYMNRRERCCARASLCPRSD